MSRVAINEESLTNLADAIREATGTTDTYDIDDMANIVSGLSMPDLSDYALKTDVPTKVSQLTNDAGYITLAEVPKTDLTGYATETYVDNVIQEYDKTITEYIDTEIAEVQKSVDACATKEYVDTAISNIPEPELPTNVSDFTNDAGYQTEAQVNTLISNALAGIATAEERSY